MPAPINYPVVPAQELMRLFTLTHHDPHSILGAHPTPPGVLVRAWRPEAARVDLIIEDGAARQLTSTHPAGLFEILVEDRAQTFPYELRTHYQNGKVFTARDPYSFLPTVSQFDEHLFVDRETGKQYYLQLQKINRVSVETAARQAARKAEAARSASTSSVEPRPFELPLFGDTVQ